MKTKEEIEKLAEKEYREYPNNPIGKEDWYYNKDNNCHRKRKAFVKGYTQCQEDLKPLIHDLWLLWLDLAEACDMEKDTSFSRKFNELEKQINNGKNNP